MIFLVCLMYVCEAPRKRKGERERANTNDKLRVNCAYFMCEESARERNRERNRERENPDNIAE